MEIINFKQHGTWKDVLNKCRRSVGKSETDKEPTDEWKNNILKAEHSPIRDIFFTFTIKNIKYWIAMHLKTHKVGFEAVVRSQRTDRTGISRDKLRQDALVDMDITCNLQALINVSRKRTCFKANEETIIAWMFVLNMIRKHDEIIFKNLRPECVYRGFCPEFKSCGYCNTKSYLIDRADYITK